MKVEINFITLWYNVNMKTKTPPKAEYKKVLDPYNAKDRKELIRKAVQRTVKEYGKALEKLGNE